MAELFGEIDELQDSEKRTISYFADSLNSDWTLIPHIELDDGEIDLLVMHKTLGGLVFEVKGGRVFVQKGSWYSEDRYGKTHSIKDPYTQAENNMFTLKKYIKKVMMYDLSLHYAACFPDIPYFDFKSPHVDGRVQTFSRKELKDNLQDRITKILELNKNPKHVPDVVERIKAELKPSINTKFSILSQVDYINSKILELEEKQFEAMKMLMHLPKLYVEGSAGTGNGAVGSGDAFWWGEPWPQELVGTNSYYTNSLGVEFYNGRDNETAVNGDSRLSAGSSDETVGGSGIVVPLLDSPGSGQQGLQANQVISGTGMVWPKWTQYINTTGRQQLWAGSTAHQFGDGATAANRAKNYGGTGVYTHHTWAVALSASPISLGAKEQYGLYVSLEYL